MSRQGRNEKAVKAAENILLNSDIFIQKLFAPCCDNISKEADDCIFNEILIRD